MGRIIPYIMENKKCSKPPTRYSNYNRKMMSVCFVERSWIPKFLSDLSHPPARLQDRRQHLPRPQTVRRDTGQLLERDQNSSGDFGAFKTRQGPKTVSSFM